MGSRSSRQTVRESSSWAGAPDDDAAPREKAEPREKMVIRVRRGALRRFDQLKTKSAGLPVEIEWDRRTSDRRAGAAPKSADRRIGERRQVPPYTWEVADFVVVGDISSSPDPDPENSSPKPKKP
jgi:hypothetical protein